MLFTVKKENIIEGLQKAAGIIPTRAGAAYLRSLWIKAEGEVLTIMATDANIEFTGAYPADVKEPGLVATFLRDCCACKLVLTDRQHSMRKK